jgi:hypothetical protein
MLTNKEILERHRWLIGKLQERIDSNLILDTQYQIGINIRDFLYWISMLKREISYLESIPEEVNK